MAQDIDNAESDKFQPTLTDELYSSLKLPESAGQAVLLRLLLEETLTTLAQHGALSDEELRGILDRAGQRANARAEHAKREIYEGLKEKGYSRAYIEEIVNRSTKSAEETLSSIREHLINKSDQ